PHVVAHHRRLIAIPFHEGGEKFLRLAANVIVIETHGRAAGCTATPDTRVRLRAVTTDAARLRVFIPHPLRCTGRYFGDDYFDIVLFFELNHSVIVAPIILSGGVLDRGPHKPVPEDVYAHLGGGLMVVFPILLRWVRLSEVNSAEGKDRLRTVL